MFRRAAPVRLVNLANDALFIRGQETPCSLRERLFDEGVAKGYLVDFALGRA
jgi:hypothetical protein